MKLRDRSISNFEIETLFRDVLNQSQIEGISNFIKLLGLYVVLNRKQLKVLSEQHFGKQIGLSYIQKAVDYNLVSEMQVESDFEEFYFQLKLGGFTFLNTIGFPHRKLKLDSAVKEKSKILSINDYLIEKGYLLESAENNGTFEPLLTKGGTILIDKLTPADLEARGIPSEMSANLETMQLKVVHFNEKIKGNTSSMLS